MGCPVIHLLGGQTQRMVQPTFKEFHITILTVRKRLHQPSPAYRHIRLKPTRFGVTLCRQSQRCNWSFANNQLNIITKSRPQKVTPYSLLSLASYSPFFKLDFIRQINIKYKCDSTIHYDFKRLYQRESYLIQNDTWLIQLKFNQNIVKVIGGFFSDGNS